MPNPATHDPEERLATRLAEMIDRVQRGELVQLETECRQTPELAADLRELWGAVLIAQAVGSASRNDDPAVTLPQVRDTPSGILNCPASLATIACSRK